VSESSTALAARLTEMASAYLPGAVVGAAFELGLFDQLGEALAADELARRLGLVEAPLARLLDALVGLGLLQREGERYLALHPDVLSSDGAVGAVFHHHRRQVAPLLAALPRVARQGGTAFDSWPFAEPPLAPDAYAELAKHPEEVAVFARAMAERSRGLGASILERAPDLREARHLVDLGGGDGTIARELLRAAPRLRITTVERGAGARLAERKTAAEGLGDRHAVVDADLRSAAVDPADAGLLAGVLADFPPGARADLLVRARDLLRPGGRLLVSETLLDPDRTSPPGAALLSLVLLIALGGGQLTEEELQADLRAAGFSEIRRHRGAEGERDLVTARR